MEKRTEIKEVLTQSLARLTEGKGSICAITGGSGYGKTHLVNGFLEDKQEIHSIFRIKGLPTEQTSLSSVYECLYHAVSGEVVAKQAFIALIKKYTRLLPTFGKYIAPLTEDLSREAFAEVVARSGIGFDAIVWPNVIKFMKEISGNRRVVLFCDDTQWLDQDSWEVIASICDVAEQHSILVILLYNDRAEVWNDSHMHIQRVFDSWTNQEKSPVWNHFQMEAWASQDLGIICSEILGGACSLSKEELEILYEFTSGIPLYIKSTLQVLQENGNLIKVGREWRSSGTWKDLDIKLDLHDSIKKRLKRVYLSLPKSRNALELASVVGETFQDSIIDAILSERTGYEIFCEIESRFKIVEYLLQQRLWTFEHNVIREVIYRSLGQHASALHKTIANCLELSPELGADALTIAYHYEKSGDKEAAQIIRVKEAERLLESAMFQSALRLVESIQDPLLSLQDKVQMLRGRLLFHTGRYEESKDCFLELLSTTEKSVVTGTTNHWIGKVLTKLSSVKDFEDAIDYLNEAKNIFESENDYRSLGDVLTDLVVTHAHLNQFKDAEIQFKRAEICYNHSNDKIGMARLQRKNVIFMESELSAPIVESVANTFGDLGVIHEQIMSLNNAATEYLYCAEFEKAAQLLKAAMEKSLDLNGFKLSYMYNNLALIDCIKNEYLEAKNKLFQAMEDSRRDVDKIVISCNLAVVLANAGQLEESINILSRILDQAETVGEYSYLIPIKTNLAQCYIHRNCKQKALEILREIQPVNENSYSLYKYSKWYRLMNKLHSELENSNKLTSSLQQYDWCLDIPDNTYYKYPYTLIDLQFWGD